MDILVEIADAAKAAHRRRAMVMTRFVAIAAQFGRFLPRLGPFGLRTAFLYAAPLAQISAESGLRSSRAMQDPHFKPLSYALFAFARDALHR
jgi:hypothetical protein